VDFTYPSNLKFECIKCGICCGDTKEKIRHVLLLDLEVKEVSEKTSLEVTDFSFKIEEKKPYSFEMKKNENGKCLFLRDNSCTIYDFRPLICRFYPFELKFNIDQDRYLFEFTLECPGINSGQEMSYMDFKKLFLLAQQRLLSNG
jgi:Fe-S-cluster containining protein